MVIGVKGGVEVANWENGQTLNLISQTFTHTGNTIEAIGNQQAFSDGYLGGVDWTLFQATLNSNSNTWWNASTNTSFEVPLSQMYPFSGWQSATGQDALSSWAQPPDVTAACTVATGTDYWLLVDAPSQNISQAGNAVFSFSMLPFGGLQGAASLTLDGIKEVQGLGSILSVASAPLPGAFTLSVNSAPSTMPGSYPITVIANIGNRTRTVTASLVVPATSVRLSAVSLAFAVQKTKSSSPPQAFTLTNFGKTALVMTGFLVSSTEYAQTNDCGISLGAGAACTAQVTFTPKAKGARKGTVQIMDKDGTSPQVVSLLGTGY
jgi:hypothetical protein